MILLAGLASDAEVQVWLGYCCPLLSNCSSSVLKSSGSQLNSLGKLILKSVHSHLSYSPVSLQGVKPYKVTEMHLSYNNAQTKSSRPVPQHEQERLDIHGKA